MIVQICIQILMIEKVIIRILPLDSPGEPYLGLPSSLAIAALPSVRSDAPRPGMRADQWVV